MAYIDKINKNSTDYDIQDSKAARSVDGTTASHVEEANEIYTTTTQSTTSEFIYRTTAGDVSINTGDASINYIVGNTVQTGHTDETLNAVGVFAESGTTVSLDKSTWRSYVATDGTYEFSYDGTNWKLSSNTVTLSSYGLSVSGTLTSGDTITVEYTQLVIGTLATATPTAFVSTGFNQYDATAGYAHVVGGNQYRIAGTYTSLGFTTTVGGTTTAVTVADNKFTPSEDGYIYVTGGSGDILIALVWSGTMDNEPYSAYSTTSVTIPTVDASNNSLPTATYGMPSVRGVADRLSFADKTYVQNIGHYSYSAANLATVEALGVDYWYDTNDIFYVLASPITYNLADSVSGTYTANDYGTEEFTGTTVALTANITYGNSLVDKLRNLLDIQSIGTGLTLTGTELSASGGGGSSSITTLTTSDYNYPVGSPDGINPIMLDSGIYKMTNGMSIYMRQASPTPSKELTYCDTYIIASYDSQIGSFAYVLSPANVDLANSRGWTCIRVVQGNRSGGGQTIERSLLTSQHVKNNLTSTDTIFPLSANQGKVLNDKITPSSGASAPTTSTTGELGKIYIDTSTDSAYMCTKVSGSTYTWKQITA